MSLLFRTNFFREMERRTQGRKVKKIKISSPSLKSGKLLCKVLTKYPSKGIFPPSVVVASSRVQSKGGVELNYSFNALQDHFDLYEVPLRFAWLAYAFVLTLCAKLVKTVAPNFAKFGCRFAVKLKVLPSDFMS